MFPPASYAVVKDDVQIVPQRYWQWNYQPAQITFDDALDEAEAVLTDALKYHIRADVPIAAFLSGGIDSSLLVSLLTTSGLVGNLRTFNVGFDEKKYDESDDARHVAEKAGSIHSSIIMSSGQGSPEMFEKIISGFDEPYGDSSCLPTYLICREMRQHVKVVISGDGGDELFGGYDRFINVLRIAQLSKIPGKGVFKLFLNALSPLIGDELFRKFNNALMMSKCSKAELFCMLHTYFKDVEKPNVYSEFFNNKLLSANSVTWKRMEKFIACSGNGLDADLMGTELALNLHADYLRKVDISSSAHGLEVRVPFLDNEVLDFAAKLPMNLKIKSGTLKYLLRELARKKISDRIADKGKWGFGIPFDSWCGPEMREYFYDLFFSKKADEGIWQLFNKSQAKILWKQFEDSSNIPYNSISRFQVYQRIFVLASLQVWFNTYKPEL
jgi:asparagine synthase (glutamine-hydrolysing)